MANSGPIGPFVPTKTPFGTTTTTTTITTTNKITGRIEANRGNQEGDPETNENSSSVLQTPAKNEEEPTVNNEPSGQAATGTVNERLIAELQEASQKEKYGARSSMGKKLGLDSFRSSKTDEERQAAIEEARNLNGVNPIVTGLGSLFALGTAYGLWTATSWLGVWFASHPVESDVFFVTRTTAVFRNVVVGLVSLASGFFGVTGLGIFLLTFRVAYGIATGELDPTPIVRKNSSNNPLKDDDFSLGNAWDLMLNKKPSARNKK